MIPRIFGAVLLLIGLTATWFLKTPESDTVLLCITISIASAGVCQLIWGFRSFAAVDSFFESGTTPRIWVFMGWLSVIVPFGLLLDWSFDRAKQLKTNELSENGVVATAIVLDKSESRRRRGIDYILKIKFATQSGTMHETEVKISSDNFKNVSIGSSLQIIFSPDDPDVLDVLWYRIDRTLYGK